MEVQVVVLPEMALLEEALLEEVAVNFAQKQSVMQSALEVAAIIGMKSYLVS